MVLNIVLPLFSTLLLSLKTENYLINLFLKFNVQLRLKTNVGTILLTSRAIDLIEDYFARRVRSNMSLVKNPGGGGGVCIRIYFW